MTETIEYSPHHHKPYMAIGVAVLAVVMGSGFFAIKQYVASSSARIATLEKKTGELSKTIEAFSGQKPGNVAAAAGIPPMPMPPMAFEKINSLEERLNTLTQQQAGLAHNAVESADARGHVSEMGSKLKEIEAAQQSMETRTKNLLMRLNSFYRLNDAVRSGKPYETELSQMMEFAADKADLRAQLEKLQPYADTGIPTPWQIAQEFKTAVHDVTAPKVAANAKFTDKLVANLKSMVVVRRVGAGADEAGPKSAIARAEAHMNKQEIEAALAEITELKDPYQSVFSDWVEMTEFTLSIPGILLTVQNKMLEDVYLTSNIAKP